MRYETNSYNTKLVFAETLKKLVNQNRSMDKVTIQAIVKSSGISRNTFYYHFSDMRDLLLWTLHDEFYKQIHSLDSFNGKQIREFVVSYMRNNHIFLTCAYQYLGFSIFRDNYVKELYPIVLKHIEELTERDHLQLKPEFIKFVAEFFAEQVGSLYMTEFHQPERYHKESAMKCLEIIFDFEIPHLLKHEQEINIKNS